MTIMRINKNIKNSTLLIDIYKLMLITMSINKNISKLFFNFIVCRENKVQFFKEKHELAFYNFEEMKLAFEEANLNINFHESSSSSLTWRGLYIGSFL